MQQASEKELQTYFQHASRGIQVVEDGLKPISFGEYLIEQKVLTRAQLFKALQLQDKNPGVRLGECVAALGFLKYPEVERHIQAWSGVDEVVVG